MRHIGLLFLLGASAQETAEPVVYVVAPDGLYYWLGEKQE